MADLYWVGGSGTWSDSGFGLNWSPATGKSITASHNGGTQILTVTAGTVVLGDNVWTTNNTYLGYAATNLGGGQWAMASGSGSTFASQSMVAAAPGSNPTAADNVFFDARSGLSNFVVDIGTNLGGAPCQNLTQSISTAGRITFKSSFGYSIFCYGTASVNAATVTDPAAPVNIAFLAPSGSITVSLNNVRFGQVSFGNGSNNASYTVGSGITARQITLNDGTLNTNGQTITLTTQYSPEITCAFQTQTSAAKTLTLGASAINIGTSASEINNSDAKFDLETGGGTVTLTAGTSTITVGSTSTVNINDVFFYGGGLSYRAVVLNGRASYLTGANTFTSSFTKNSVSNNSFLNVSANQTVSSGGTFTLSGTATNRLLVLSDLCRAQRTFTLTGTTTRTLSHVSFMDINFVFSSSVTGTSIGDFGNNSGITVAAPTTRYLVLGGVNKSFNSTTAWSATSGGATGATVPLPQDTVIMNAASGSGDLSMNTVYAGGNINTTGFTGTLTSVYGKIYSLGQPTDPNGILSGLGYVTYRFFSNITLSSPANFSIDGGSASAFLPGNTSVISSITMLSGTLNTNSYNLTCSAINSQYVATTYQPEQSTDFTVGKGYVFGSSTISLTSSFPITFGPLDSVNAGTSTVQFTSTETFNTVAPILNSKNLYNLKLMPGSASMRYSQLSGSSFNNITLDSHTSLIFISLTSGETLTVGSLNVNGTKGAGVIIGSNLFSTFHGSYNSTIAIGSDVVTEYVAFWGITKSGASGLFARGAADLGGNSGISFQQHSVLAFSGSGATSFAVPGNFTGSSYFVVIGAGGGAGKRSTSTALAGGGGGGAVAVVTNLNISVGQTIYLNSPTGGAGATTSGSGGSPANAWINIIANSQPSVTEDGASADSGNGSAGSTLSSAGAGGNTTFSVGDLKFAGGSGGAGTGNFGGSGGSCGSLLFRTGIQGLGGGSNYGGAGGASIQNLGSVSPTSGGNGGGVAPNSGGVGGANGNPPVVGGSGAAGTSVGGGGGGGSTAAGVNGAAGGNGASGSQWTYNSLNGVAGSGAIGYGGAGGSGGGIQSTSLANSFGGRGGNGATGSGGASGGRGSTTGGGTGNGGNGGNSLVLFVYVENRGGTFATIIG